MDKKEFRRFFEFLVATVEVIALVVVIIAGLTAIVGFATGIYQVKSNAFGIEEKYSPKETGNIFVYREDGQTIIQRVGQYYDGSSCFGQIVLISVFADEEISDSLANGVMIYADTDARKLYYELGREQFIDKYAPSASNKSKGIIIGNIEDIEVSLKERYGKDFCCGVFLGK